MKSAMALAVAAGLPKIVLHEHEERWPDWLVEFQRTGILRCQTITLEDTLVVDESFVGCHIEYVTFIVSPRFPLGNPAIEVSGDMRTVLAYSEFIDDHGRCGTLFKFSQADAQRSV